MDDSIWGKKLTAIEREQLVTNYTPLVNAIAKSLSRRLPSVVDVDDLIQDGLLGLLAAILHSTAGRTNEHFRNYLSQRVRGSMLDGLREVDQTSRRVRQQMRKVEGAIHQLGHELGRAPGEVEIAAALSMPLPVYQTLLMDAQGYTLLSLDDFDDEDPEKNFLDWCATTHSDPLAALEREALQRTILNAISHLSTQEERIMTLYYEEELTMRVIGNLLEISESRVSQIHTQAIAKLRAAVVGGDAKASLLTPRWRLS